MKHYLGELLANMQDKAERLVQKAKLKARIRYHGFLAWWYYSEYVSNGSIVHIGGFSLLCGVVLGQFLF